MTDFEISELLNRARSEEPHKRILIYAELNAIGTISILEALDNIADKLERINVIQPKKKRGERGKDKKPRKEYKKRVSKNLTSGR